MDSDYKVLLDVEEGLMAPVGVTVERETSTHNGRWKMWGALLAMALCVSAALLFTWNHKVKQHHKEFDSVWNDKSSVQCSLLNLFVKLFCEALTVFYFSVLSSILERSSYRASRR